jgi:hypothetical protein
MNDSLTSERMTHGDATVATRPQLHQAEKNCDNMWSSLFALLLFMVEKSCWAGEVRTMSQELKETFGSRRDSCRVMSARKRRVIDGDSRSHGAPAVREHETCCWSIHPHGSGMMATMHTSHGQNLSSPNDFISNVSFIAISDSSPSISLDIQPRALPSSKVLGLLPVKCKHALSTHRPSLNQMCIVTASDIKQEIMISVIQLPEEHASSALPLLPLLSLSLSKPSSLSCSIADGPTVVLWRISDSGVGCECVCIQWLGQHWAMNDASLPHDSASVCCFAHCLGPSPDAATFVFSNATGCGTCIIPALLSASSHLQTNAATITQAIAAALHPVLPVIASPGMTARILMKNTSVAGNDSLTPSLLLSRASYCRFMCLQPRGVRSSSVIFTLRIVHSLSQNILLLFYITTKVPAYNHTRRVSHLARRSTHL